MAPFSSQLLNWYQYFDWQWSRALDAAPTPSPARLPFTLLFLALGLAGLWATLRVDPRVFAYLATLIVLLTLGLFILANVDPFHRSIRELLPA